MMNINLPFPSYEPELLSPAGNWDCVKAAVANGANAIYFGLPKFNARLRADNFSEADLPELMAFLHSRGVKGFVTMNTLVFTNELEAAVEYLRQLEKSGVDGLIVQDLGLCSLVKKVAPHLELHASTQMTLTSPEGIHFVERFLPLDRAVLARELNLDEIAACEPLRIPIEVFVHGALCVSYSGQCLTSESLGKRSANRGECAQACRLPYGLVVDGAVKDMGERRYLLSPQDLSALDCIPALVERGVKSFKIEGRLKSPEYVAAVTAVYRKALDAACGKVKEKPSFWDRYDLQMVFSRGFYTGWLEGTNHPALTHGRHGKKRGAYVGEIMYCGRGWIDVDPENKMIPLSPGDGFVFDAGEDRNEEQGGRIWKVEGHRLYFHGKGGNIDWTRVEPGMKLWKTDDPALDGRLRKSWKNISNEPVKSVQKITFVVRGCEGDFLRISVPEFGVEVKSDKRLELALKRPLSVDVLEAQLGRLGDTNYELDHVEMLAESDVMVPVSVLNKMRRALVDLMDNKSFNALKTVDDFVQEDFDLSTLMPRREKVVLESETELRILCRTLEQTEAVLDAGARCVYLDFEDIRDYPEGVKLVRSYEGALVFLATPRIQKPSEVGYFQYILKTEPDGVLVRNLGGLEFFRDKGLRLVGDFSLNVANPLTADLLVKNAGLEQVTVSYDLNVNQVLALAYRGCPDQLELVIHQHMPMFHMEHCVFCTFLSDGQNYKNCGRPCEQHDVYLKDRVGEKHRLLADVGCRNTLYNGTAQSGVMYYNEFLQAGIHRFRIELVDESGEEAAELFSLYHGFIKGTVTHSMLMSRLHVIERVGVTEGTLATY